MFPRLAEQYRVLASDLVMSLQALAMGLKQRGHVATCYVCGDEQTNQGASLVADLGERHTVRFLVSDSGISWVECRDGCELVRFEGAEAIQELQRLAVLLQSEVTGAEPGRPHQPTDQESVTGGAAQRLAPVASRPRRKTVPSVA